MHKLNKTILLSVLVATIQACATVGPDYAAPNLDPIEIPETQVASIVDREVYWWRHFEDNTLDKIVELTIQNNLSLKMAAENVKRSLAIFEDVDNDDLPSGSIDASYQAQDQQIPGFGNQRVNSRSYELGASLNWSADLFGKIERARQAAQANAEAEFLNLQDLQVQIVSQAVQAYGDLKGLKNRIRLLEKNANIVDQTRSIVQSRYQEGFASELDLKRIEAQYFGVRSGLPDLQADYRRTKNFLEALLGSTTSLSFLELDKLDSAQLSLNKPFAIGDVSQFLQYRPDIYSAERRLAAASANIGRNKAELYPDISVNGFIGFLTGSISGSLSDSEAWRVSPSLNWNILDYGSIQARVKAAEAEERSAYFDFQESVLAAIKEADTSLNAYTNIQEKHNLLQEQLLASQTAYSLARDLYDSGEIGLLDLLDAERQAVDIEDEFVVSNIRTFTSIVDVYKVFGGGSAMRNEQALSLSLAVQNHHKYE